MVTASPGNFFCKSTDDQKLCRADENLSHLVLPDWCAYTQFCPPNDDATKAYRQRASRFLIDILDEGDCLDEGQVYITIFDLRISERIAAKLEFSLRVALRFIPETYSSLWQCEGRI